MQHSLQRRCGVQRPALAAPRRGAPVPFPPCLFLNIRVRPLVARPPAATDGPGSKQEPPKDASPAPVEAAVEATAAGTEAAAASTQAPVEPAAAAAAPEPPVQAEFADVPSQQKSAEAPAEEPAAAEPSSPTPEAAAAGTTAAVATSHPLTDVGEEEEDLIASKELVAELADGASFGKRGEQWLVAQLLVVAIIVFPPLTLKGLVDFAATVALTAGAVFILTSLFNLGRSLSPLPQPRKKHALVTGGIYSYVRHPMYGGVLLAALGFTILTRNETRMALTLLLWWILDNKANVEEGFLEQRYPEYAEYKAKVKKFLPFLY